MQDSILLVGSTEKSQALLHALVPQGRVGAVSEVHSGGEARRPAAENKNRFVFHQFLMFSFLAAFLYASMIAS